MAATTGPRSTGDAENSTRRDAENSTASAGAGPAQALMRSSPRRAAAMAGPDLTCTGMQTAIEPCDTMFDCLPA